MRSDIGLHNLKHLRKGIVERMMRVLRRSGPRVVSLSPYFRGGVGEWSTVGTGAGQFQLSKLVHNSSFMWPSRRQ